MKEVENNSRTGNLEQSFFDLVASMGLGGRIRVSSRLTTHDNDRQLVLAGAQTVRLDPKSGLPQIEQGRVDSIIKTLVKTFDQVGGNKNALELLGSDQFLAASLTEAHLENPKGNTLLCTLTNRPGGSIPCLYGSTDGINFAEVMETISCAGALGQKDLKSFVVFDTEGNTSNRAKGILKDSLEIIPEKALTEFNDFVAKLGPNITSQRIRATELLLGADQQFYMFSAKEIFDQMGPTFTLGKLLLLARLAGENPLLFKEIRANDLMGRIGVKDLAMPVARATEIPTGFTFYAREAVIAADYLGVVCFPFKLTTHANIYKILGPYGSLFSAEKQSGAILCPITRQRIQTKEQAELGSDPCDVLVLAYLAQKFPHGFQRLVGDFKTACRVLTMPEALEAGTADNKFIVENYFPIESL